ncbi:MAG: hydroxymethylbilane synthase [Desulfatitalea sp.]|nr:hydroxymethylbilane synthase [Desulfatitalea sp.]
MNNKILRIGTRGSQLALWQAHWVRKAVLDQQPDAVVALEILKTQGDKILDVPLAQVGGKGLFVKEIEEALLDGRIDLAVHSMKDMPAELPVGLCVAAIPRRENPLDAFVSNNYGSLDDLPQGARVGTSSLRRGAQILHHRPDLVIVPLRGNVDTRLKKLETDDLDAIVLASAGLTRLGLANHITTRLDTGTMLPAVGQGALCIEARDADAPVMDLLSALDHQASHMAVVAERAFLRRLEGGCQVPLAAYATLDQGLLTITGLVAELDGSRVIKSSLQGPPETAEPLGRQLAEQLLDRGAGDILERLQAHAR